MISRQQVAVGRASVFGSRTVVIGVLGTALTMLAGALVFAMISPALNTADETGHVDYAFQLWHGHLPIFERGISFKPPFGNRPPVQWEAQHPPLFYALLAPAVGLLADAGHPMMAVLAARAICALIAAACVVGLAWAAGWMSPRPQPSWMIMVAAVAAPISPFLRVGGSVYNDDLAALFTVLALGVTLRAIQSGPTRRVIIAAALAAAGGMLSRANFITTLLTMSGGLVLAWWIHSRSPWPKRIATSIGIALIPVAAAALASGWFYLRNIRLTGSWTGGHPDWAEANLGRHTKPLGTVIDQTQGGWTLIRQLFLERTGKWATYGPKFVTALLVLSAVVLVVRVIHALVERSALGGSSRDPQQTARFDVSAQTVKSVSVTVVLLVQFGITMVVLFTYVAGGGGPITRYLLPALLPISVAFAYGLFGLGRRLRAPALALYCVVAWGQYVAWVVVQPHTGGSILTGHTMNGVPGVLVLLALVALLAGVVVAVAAVHLDSRTPSIAPGVEDPPTVAIPVVPDAAASGAGQGSIPLG